MQQISPSQPSDHTFTAPITDGSILSLPDLSDMSGLGGLGGLGGDMDSSFSAPTASGADQPSQILYPPPHATRGGSDPQWDLISLGLEEPLPPQDAIDELYVSGCIS
jgi:hypothetical protein